MSLVAPNGVTGQASTEGIKAQAGGNPRPGRLAGRSGTRRQANGPGGGGIRVDRIMAGQVAAAQGGMAASAAEPAHGAGAARGTGPDHAADAARGTGPDHAADAARAPALITPPMPPGTPALITPRTPSGAPTPVAQPSPIPPTSLPTPPTTGWSRPTICPTGWSIADHARPRHRLQPGRRAAHRPRPRSPRSAGRARTCSPLRDAEGHCWWRQPGPYHGLSTRTRHPERSLFLPDGTELLVTVGYVRGHAAPQPGRDGPGGDSPARSAGWRSRCAAPSSGPGSSAAGPTWCPPWRTSCGRR